MNRSGHYVVIENTPGYLPEGDPGVFGTINDARRFAIELARQLRDGGYKVVGSSRILTPLPDQGFVVYRAVDRTGDSLGRVISISGAECKGGDCELCQYQEGLLP